MATNTYSNGVKKKDDTIYGTVVSSSNPTWNNNSYQPTQSTVQNQTNPIVQAANNVKNGTSTQATYTSPARQTLDSMNNYINNNAQFQYTAPQPFSYDYNTDPAYQSALREAQRTIENQQVDTNAMLRASGQGKSSYSETVANQIGTKTMASLADTLVPQLMQQAYQRYTDDVNRNLQVQQLNYGTQQDAVSNLGNLYGLQNNEYFQNPITEAQLTGNYMPEEARQAVANLLSLKQQAETKGITREQRNALSAQADTLRTQLSALGIDPSLYGANVNYDTAKQNQTGIRTLEGQQLDLQRQNANLNAASAYMDATGKVLAPSSNWGDYVTQSQQKGTPNTIGVQQYNEQFAYQKARDAIADQQYKMQFDEDTRQFGLQYALSKQVQLGGLSLDQARLALSQDDNARQWAALDWEMTNANTSNNSGLTANQVLDSMRSLYTEPTYTTDKEGKQTKAGSQITKDANKRKSLIQNVVDSGLSNTEIQSVLSSLGFTKAEMQSAIEEATKNSGN